MTPFTPLDLILTTVLGFLVGVLWASVRIRRVDSKDRPIARILAHLLEPPYWWADLYGADGRPSHAKLVYTASLGVALAGMIWIGKSDVGTDGDVSFGFLGYVLLVLTFALGKQMFNHLSLYLVAKFGDKAAAEIARRASGATVTPPGATE